MVMIVGAESAAQWEAAQRLTQEYVASLPASAGAVAPETADELRAFCAGGFLLLAIEGDPIGCVAVRPLRGIGRCEMKRLYVCASHRGSGAGHALAVRAIEEARRRHFAEMFLDTLPSMSEAHALYAKLGFEACEPYEGSPADGRAHLRLALRHAFLPLEIDGRLSDDERSVR
jgi:GNAT superfamily N-acetyltransferase